MKQMQAYTLEVCLKVLLPILIIIVVAIYPFYERKKVNYPPIQFVELLRNTLGNKNYDTESILDKGFLISHSVIVKKDVPISNFKNFLVEEHWTDMGLNQRGQEVYCLDPNNSIVIVNIEGKTFIGYSYKTKGLS